MWSSTGFHAGLLKVYSLDIELPTLVQCFSTTGALMCDNLA